MAKLNIVHYLNAGFPLLFCPTIEQERALETILRDLSKAQMEKPLSVMLWKITTGLYSVLAENPKKEAVSLTLLDALTYMAEGDKGNPPKDKLYVLFNIKEQLPSPAIRQQLRDTVHAIRSAGSTIVVIGAQHDIPEELEDVVSFIEFNLPTKEELKKSFREIVLEYQDTLGLKDAEIDPLLELSAENATGLTEFKAENALALALTASDDIDIEMLRHEKQMAVKQSGVLEYIPHQESMDTLGGFDALKAHVAARARFFAEHQEAVDFGLEAPKGILLCGLAGTGKTLASKAVAQGLGLPLFKFDVGALFKGIVGQSEATTKNALKLIETVAPCVLLLDEAV